MKRTLPEILRLVLNSTLSLSARAVIPAIAVVAIYYAATTGNQLPPALMLIASGVGASALANVLAKFDQSKDVTDSELREAIEDALNRSGIQQRLEDNDFQEPLAALLQRFDVLGTVLQIHENSTVNRILRGLAYYEKLWLETISRLDTDLRNSIQQLDPEIRLVSQLAYNFQGLAGLLEYVDLHGRGTAPTSRVHKRFDKLVWDQSFQTIEREIRSDSSQGNPPEKLQFNSIREVVDQYPQMVLVGEPGAGKTTTLKRLALDAVRQRLVSSNAPMPLLLRLPAWKQDQTLEEFLISGWFLNTDPIIALRRGDALLYLDGLNEMGSLGPQRAAELRAWLKSVNAPQRIVVTCRAKAYVGDLDLGLPAILAEEMDESQIRTFVNNYLEQNAATRLLSLLIPQAYWEWQDPRHLYHLARNPFMLTAFIVVYIMQNETHENSLPRNMGTLFRELIKTLWEREKIRNTPGWVEHAEMVNRFAGFAFSMIAEEQPTEVPLNYALQHLGGESLLTIGENASILQINDGKVTFYHQLMQEYFAAVELDRTGVSAILVAPTKYMYGGRIGTRWDQVLVSLAGITTNPDGVVSQIVAVDTYLAAACIGSGVSLSATVRNDVVSRILADNDDPQYTVATLFPPLAQAKEDRVVQPLIDLLDEPNFYRVGRRALESLILLGEIAVPALLNALDSPTSRAKTPLISALGGIRDKRAIPRLIELLDDYTEEYVLGPNYICLSAAIALKTIGTDSVLALIRNWQHNQLSHLIQLGNNADKALIAIVAELLKDPLVGTREEILTRISPSLIFNLGEILNVSATTIPRPGEGDIDWHAVGRVDAILEFLVAVGNGAAVQCLSDAIKRPRFADQIKMALHRINSLEALAVVTEYEGPKG